jgi:glycosyltransferase involved in cell wall biosynthesis
VPKKLAAIVESLDHVCYRYRLQAFEPYLNSSGWNIEAYSMPRGIAAILKTFLKIRSADLVFVQRKLPGSLYLRLLLQNAKRLVFDFDDAVYRRDSFARKGASRKLKRRFEAIVDASDAIIAGNKFLSKCALNFAHQDRVETIPTCIDITAYEREEAFGYRNSPDAAMELVWIGSSSTLPLLAGQEEMLERIGRTLHPIHLKVICDSFPVFEYLPVQPVPWSTETEIQELKSSHVGISWLPEDEWGKGKCGLKVLQYMAAGLPVVANPFGVHLEMVEHCKSGFLPDTPEAWIHAITTLQNDPELARRMGSRGRQIVLERYTVSHWAPILLNLLNGSGDE